MEQALSGDSHRRIRPGRLIAVVIACGGLLTTMDAPAAAQTERPPEQLAFTRPESWALARFTSATLLSGLGVPATREPGDVSLGLEFGWLPHLTAAQQQVGFNGADHLDMNQAPFVPRPRVTVGLPARFSVTVSATPPVPMFGLRATLFALGLERPVLETQSWTFGLRGYGQLGRVTGAYTCPRSVVAFPEGSPNNIMGCDVPSSDTASLRYIGGEASIAYRSEETSRFSPHAAIGVTYMDVGFQVNALTFGFLDRTHYVSQGTAISASGGASWRLTSRLDLGVDLFYSPLDVRRGLGAPLQNDGFFNVRALVSYRIR